MADIIDLQSWKDERAEAKFERRWHLKNGAELDKPLPPENFLIQGLGITAPSVVIIGGAGFGGKTMATQSLALAIASGKKVWGQYEARQGRVIHLDWEQDTVTTRRYQRLAWSMGVDLSKIGDDLLVSSLPEGYLDDEDGESDMRRLCDGAAVCIMDAFRGAFPTAQENDSGVRQYLDMLRRVSVTTGCTMIVIAHSRKMGADVDVRSSLRGSGALFDAADSVFMLDGQRNRPTQVHNTKDRITGKLRDTFGLRVEDESDGENIERGLAVRYVSPEDMQAANVAPEWDDNHVAMSAERVATLGMSLLDTMSRRGQGMTLAQIRSLSHDKTNTQAALDFLEQERSVRRDGKVYYVDT